MNHRLPCLAVAIALISACGSGDGTTTAVTPGAVSVPATDGPATEDTSFNDADVVFAQNMIPHHEQAIDMADLALDPAAGAGAELVALAEQIKAAQGPEVATMTGWLESWSQPQPSEMGHDDHDMAGMDGMAGLMSSDDMAALAAAHGAAFDELWLELMVEHHQGAIAMADKVKVEGEDPAVATLADAVIAAQQEEIAEMDQLLAS